MIMLNGYGFRYAQEVGFNPKRNAGNFNSGKWNRFTGSVTILSPAGE